MERFFTRAVAKCLTWLFLLFGPVVAAFTLLWAHLQNGGGIIQGWGTVPLISFAAVFLVYYPGLVIYASMALMHMHISIPKPYRMGKVVKTLFIFPAIVLVAYVLLTYAGITDKGLPPMQALFSNNGFLAIVFIYYPIVTLYEIFTALFYRMRYFFSAIP